MPNNTYLNNFDIFNKVFRKQFKIKNFEIENLIGTPTPKKGYFKLTVKNKFSLPLWLNNRVVTLQLVISWKVTKSSCEQYAPIMFRLLGYLLPSSHTLPLTTQKTQMVKRARLPRSSIRSILQALDIGDGCRQQIAVSAFNRNKFYFI